MIEYIPFDPSMIGQKEIIIWCPAELKLELLQQIEELGVRWGDGMLPTEFTPRSNNSLRITSERRMTQATKRYYEQSFREGSYKQYTFVKYPGIEVTVDVGGLI